jgi:hypothetical protein
VNVTKPRFCLIESDKDSLQQQYANWLVSGLPIAATVYSGGDSIHALVKVDPNSLEEYNTRVANIFEYMGLANLDENNKDACRYTRVPGIMRPEKGYHQALLTWDLGAASFDTWWNRHEPRAF